MKAIKMKLPKLVKPKGSVWINAERYICDFYLSKLPFCGGHLVFAVVGRKWVRIAKGDMLYKGQRQKQFRFRISIKEWQSCNPRMARGK